MKRQLEESNISNVCDLPLLNDSEALGSCFQELMKNHIDNSPAVIIDMGSNNGEIEQLSPRKLRESKVNMSDGKKVIQQRPKGELTVKANLSLASDLKAELKKSLSLVSSFLDNFPEDTVVVNTKNKHETHDFPL